jgi:hypothetical protein
MIAPALGRRFDYLSITKPSREHQSGYAAFGSAVHARPCVNEHAQGLEVAGRRRERQRICTVRHSFTSAPRLDEILKIAVYPLCEASIKEVPPCLSFRFRSIPRWIKARTRSS